MPSITGLSSNDNAVLGALFDAEASLDRGSGYIKHTSTVKIDPLNERLEGAEKAAIRNLSLAEPDAEDVNSAILALTSIIDTNPRYASAYVNRAQARRLLPGALEQAVVVADIFSDLDIAVSTASPSSPKESITSDTARVLSSAHTHRGSLLMRASVYKEFREILVSLNLPLLRTTVEASQFEDLASKDFSVAGRYGNKTAQELAVKTNPYAKLCGQIVKEALQREIQEYYEYDQVH